MKPNNDINKWAEEVVSLIMETAKEADPEPGSSNISVPPGFERVVLTTAGERDNAQEIERRNKKAKLNGGRHSKKTILRLSDLIKEKARKHKEARKQKRNKQRKVREEADAVKWSSSEDEIESTEEETEEIWGSKNSGA
ncbi:hypothetical protein PIB30_068228 [Stylosanthes scabra]|uniref:Uncharacterized protein n=1 Tax=Stylosanthes scabra TaxID=79078 RepID=A0ABU6YKD5_9FABA|nr:hypothetical protein [Stylosanthes scabra]